MILLAAVLLHFFYKFQQNNLVEMSTNYKIKCNYYVGTYTLKKMPHASNNRYFQTYTIKIYVIITNNYIFALTL